MPDDIPQVALDQAKAAVNDKPSVAASAEKWAAEAKKVTDGAEAKSKAALETAVKAASEPEKTEAPGDKPRDANGKFLPEKGKAKDEAKTQKAAPQVAKQKAGEALPPVAVTKGKPGDGLGDEGVPSATPEFAGGLGKVKRLFREGKVEDAFKLLDLPADKVPNGIWASLRKESRAREAEVVAAHRVVEEKSAALKEEARQLVAQLRPFAEAKQALESGDEDRVFEILWGKSVDTWQRERLGRMHRGDLSKDPAVAEATRRAKAAEDAAAQLRKELAERDQKGAEREHAVAMERAGANWREQFKGRLEESSDPRLQAAAELPWFVKAVHKEMLDNYKFDEVRGTEDCITEEEAIERVYDPERLTAAQWQQLTGGHSPTVERVPGTQTQEFTGRRAIDVKRVAKAPTSLSRSASAEAAPARKRDAKESLTYWVSQALASGKTG